MDDSAWSVRVYYEDTDSGGVVYHANYLKFMERARTEWLRRRGFEQDELARHHNVIFAVRQMSVDFLKPARFNDQLLVLARLGRAGRASLFFDQAVLRQAAPDSAAKSANRSCDYDTLIRDKDKLLCTASVKVACLTADGLRPRALPQPLLMEISE
ncbi:MAG TPA: tol-pal system-associated acyl-CoA thioesterase [Gammaproteobacteria bacterium]|nr:tol-pal system-associated acyl-CoA thioesterase [Gammaproteobacteria bacterium]